MLVRVFCDMQEASLLDITNQACGLFNPSEVRIWQVCHHCIFSTVDGFKLFTDQGHVVNPYVDCQPLSVSYELVVQYEGSMGSSVMVGRGWSLVYCKTILLYMDSDKYNAVFGR